MIHSAVLSNDVHILGRQQVRTTFGLVRGTGGGGFHWYPGRLKHFFPSHTFVTNGAY